MARRACAGEGASIAPGTASASPAHAAAPGRQIEQDRERGGPAGGPCSIHDDRCRLARHSRPAAEPDPARIPPTPRDPPAQGRRLDPGCSGLPAAAASTGPAVRPTGWCRPRGSPTRGRGSPGGSAGRSGAAREASQAPLLGSELPGFGAPARHSGAPARSRRRALPALRAPNGPGAVEGHQTAG